MVDKWESPCGRVVLYCGDCLEVLPTIGPVDAFVTDPPYGIGFAAQPTKWQRQKGHQPKKWDDKTSELVSSLPSLAPSIIWGGNYYDLPLRGGWLSWHKPDAPPSMGQFELAWTSCNSLTRQLSVSISETNPERVGHPTQKPLRLMKWCIGFLPVDADRIADLYMGSGTTGVAAVKLGRSFVGIEKEPAYFEIAKRRIMDALGMEVSVNGVTQRKLFT